MSEQDLLKQLEEAYRKDLENSQSGENPNDVPGDAAINGSEDRQTVPGEAASKGDKAKEAEVVKDVAYYQNLAAAKAKEAAEAQERAKKRDADLERGLHENIHKRKELESALEERDRQLEELKRKLEAKKLEDEPMVDDEAFNAFSEEFSDLAPHVKRLLEGVAHSTVERARLEAKRVKDELDAQRNELKTLIERAKSESAQADNGRHFAAVQAIVPDASQIFDPNGLLPAFNAWAEDSGVPLFSKVATAPPSFAPEDVAYVLKEFKKACGITEVPKPKPGDKLVKTGSESLPTDRAESDVFSQEQLSDPAYIDRLLQESVGDYAKLQALNAKLKKSLNRR